MRCKLFTVISLTVFALFFTACRSSHSTMAPGEINLLGIVKCECESYAYTGPNTFAIHTNEFFPRKNYSGNMTTFLWGLVTLKDY